MINFRFHIVSLTAVLLSLGIGLVLGTAFLDDALISTLRGQLDGLESDLDRERTRVSDHRRSLDSLETEYQMLDDELGVRVLADRLAEMPVLVVTETGVDSDLVPRMLETLDEADADLVGVWELTEDLALGDEDAVARLAQALDLSIDNPDRLRDNVLDQLGDVLYGATDAAESADPELQGLAAGQPDEEEPGETAPPDGESDDVDGEIVEFHEPQLLSTLHSAGFVDYEVPDDRDTDVVELPSGGLRVLVVTDAHADVPGLVLERVLNRLTSEGPAPVVVAVPSPDDEAEDVDDVAARSLVNRVRTSDDLSGRVSTVDNGDRLAGKVAVVLALEAAVPGEPRLGDYGDDADDLLPPPNASITADD